MRRKLIDFVGFSVIFSSIVLIMFTLLIVLRTGGVVIIEPILPIIVAELALTFFGLAYTVYLFNRTVFKVSKGGK